MCWKPLNSFFLSYFINNQSVLYWEGLNLFDSQYLYLWLCEDFKGMFKYKRRGEGSVELEQGPRHSWAQSGWHLSPSPPGAACSSRKADRGTQERCPEQAWSFLFCLFLPFFVTKHFSLTLNRFSTTQNFQRNNLSILAQM